jgi:flagellar export protein FliJ
MKPFHFSLESLRVLRRQKERVAQQRYARALAACDEAGRQLQHAASELATGWNLLGHELDLGIAAGRLAGLQTWCRVLESRKNERQAALEKNRCTAELMFREMILAIRNRKALDRFYDKSRYAYDCEAQREEQKTYDELAVQLSNTPGPLQFTGRKN